MEFFMPIKRVLTIESVNDDTTRNMLNTIYNSPKFKDFNIDHCFVFKSGAYSINEEMLHFILKTKIDETKPQLILFHIGNRVKRNIRTFIKVVSKVKQEYHKILYGTQKRSSIKTDYPEFANLLDNHQEILKLEKLFFKINR